MSEVKVILSLETKQVAEQAAEAGKTMEKMAEESAQAVQEASVSSEKAVTEAAEKSAESVKDAAEKSASSVETVKEAADDAAESHRKAGEAAKQAGEKTGSGMKQAAGSIKSAAGAASGVVSALGGVAPQLGFIGSALQMLLSGPIAAITAAVTALITAATMAWDACTVSAEEYRQKLAAILDLQGKVTERIRDSMDTSTRYLNRLEEIDRMEIKGNAAKAEQARLLEILTKRYGDLGIVIDEETGKMSGFDEARKRMRGEDASTLADSLQTELGIKLQQLPQVKVGISSGNAEERKRLSTILAGYDPDKVQRSYETVSGTLGPSITRETMSGPKINLREERAFLDDYLHNSHITDEDTIATLKARIDALDDIFRTADEITRLRVSGYSSEADEMASMSAATSREQTRAGGQIPNPSPEPNPEEMKLSAIRDGVQGVIDRYQMLKREQELIAEGREREAVIEKETMALRRRAAQMGVELTQEQIDSMEEAVGSWYDYVQSIKPTETEKIDRSGELDDIAGKIAALYRPDAPGMVTNSLVARGGSAAGIRMPDLERYQRATSESTARLVELTEEQKRLIAEGALI
ncbi:MAG: hypothetical protein J6Y92_09275 [Lentisphaeria bacterium]|nr:hypothetical protein [Lentisphaeria bacterium]